MKTTLKLIECANENCNVMFKPVNHNHKYHTPSCNQKRKDALKKVKKTTPNETYTKTHKIHLDPYFLVRGKISNSNGGCVISNGT